MEALAFPSKQKKKLYRELLRKTLSYYLGYVNKNLVLSASLGTGFYDWADFSPFYKRKFINVGYSETRERKSIKESHKLFSISFPEFEIRDTKGLIKTLQDKRVKHLRKLVQNAVDGKVVFDEKFAKQTLREILNTERKASSRRNIVSYLTIPLDFFDVFPGLSSVMQKGIEELAGFLIDKKLKKKHQWFYLLSDITK